jgi:hypothetical protein
MAHHAPLAHHILKFHSSLPAHVTEHCAKI